MLSFKPLLCRHDFYWSERHRSDRCRRCGFVRPASEAVAPVSTGLAALRAADVGAGFQPTTSRPTLSDAVLENWDRIDAPRAPAAAAPNGSQLLESLDALIAGGELSRAQTIETLLALIEDGQSSDPVLFGPSAAAWYARLHSAR